ncbi:hypothetical protein NH340_JMT00980 [Sarcoptes scabiei]|nr:hypothetical protein NH340_JMT00980 [Sarcoptes scabiei]
MDIKENFLEFLFTLLLCSLIESIRMESNLQLKSVAIILRHGDRTPLHFFRYDKYQNESFWIPPGLGAVTEKGQQRTRASAESYRKKYSKFLKQNKDEMKFFDVTTSKVTRTNTTATQFMQTLLKNDTSAKIFYHQNNQMLSAVSTCKRSDELLEQWHNSSEVRSLWSDKIDFIKMIENKTGNEYLKYETKVLVRLTWLYNTLMIEKEHNFSLPDWAQDPLIIEQLKEFCRLNVRSYFNTDELQRLRGQLFFKDIKQNMDDADRKHRFRLYSTHDMMQALFLQILGLYDQLDQRMPPSFSSSIVFEVYQQSMISNESHDDNVTETIRNDQQFIRFLYREVLDSKTEQGKFEIEEIVLRPSFCSNNTLMQIPGYNDLEPLCEWEQFLQHIERLLLSKEWKEECLNGTIRQQHSSIVFSIILMILFATKWNHSFLL